MIVVDDAPPEALALADAMSALSAQMFDATWHAGCELPIWQALSDSLSSWRARADRALLDELSRAWWKAGGWVVWDDQHGLVWVTDTEWARMRVEQGAP